MQAVWTSSQPLLALQGMLGWCSGLLPQSSRALCYPTHVQVACMVLEIPRAVAHAAGNLVGCCASVLFAFPAAFYSSLPSLNLCLKIVHLTIMISLPCRCVAYLLQPGLVYTAPTTGDLVVLVKAKVVTYEPPAPQPPPQHSVFSTTASGEVVIADSTVQVHVPGKRREQSTQQEVSRGAQEPAGPVPSTSADTPAGTSSGVAAAAEDICTTGHGADTTGLARPASVVQQQVAPAPAPAAGPASSSPAATTSPPPVTGGSRSFREALVGNKDGRAAAESAPAGPLAETAEAATPRTPAASGEATAGKSAAMQANQGEDMDVDAH
jgi:hypothetical protein